MIQTQICDVCIFTCHALVVLLTGQHKQNERTQTSLHQVGFKLTTPVFEEVKTVHALGRVVTVIGCAIVHVFKIHQSSIHCIM
jgi:hypothetical protein